MMSEKFLLNSIKIVAFLGIVGLLFVFPLEGHAESVFSKALDTLYVTFQNARVVVYVTAGFGLIGVAVAAISGKLPWQWLAMISVALFTLAMAEKIVLYVTGSNVNSNTTSDFSGELGDSEFKINLGNDRFDLDFDNLKAQGNDSNFKNYLQNGN